MSEPAAGRRDWRPTASREALVCRARVLARTRAFFATRGVLEVETPQLAAAPVTDPHLEAISCRLDLPSATGSYDGVYYLQTSPEYAMKRLLAAGSGPIYQIARAFRDGEVGRRHNPEFTLLEWYRPGFDHLDLMTEVAELLLTVLGEPAPAPPVERLSYAEAFRRHAGVDSVHTARPDELSACAEAAGVEVVGLDPHGDRDDWLHLLMSHLVEPRLGRDAEGRRVITLLYDYPATQAALARIRPAEGDRPAVAERFEVYVDGVELANGFHELEDAAEQRRRFEADLDERRRRGSSTPPIDECLLDALDAGLGDCAGVALGIDRLVMLASGAEDLREVLAFPIDRA
ncbi:MAG: EF-P lysine aminoacylase EpmA [Acidobacteriota bacterium]